jgi:hypothetical protein
VCVHIMKLAPGAPLGGGWGRCLLLQHIGVRPAHYNKNRISAAAVGICIQNEYSADLLKI